MEDRSREEAKQESAADGSVVQRKVERDDASSEHRKDESGDDERGSEDSFKVIHKDGDRSVSSRRSGGGSSQEGKSFKQKRR